MGKRQDFIDLYRSGKGTRQKYIDLSGNYFRRKSRQGVLDPFKPLTILDMLQSGAFARDLRHGGIASLAPRRGRVTHPGGYGGKEHPLGPDWDDLREWMIEHGYDIEVPLPGEHSTGKPKPTLHAKGGLARILDI